MNTNVLFSNSKENPGVSSRNDRFVTVQRGESFDDVSANRTSRSDDVGSVITILISLPLAGILIRGRFDEGYGQSEVIVYVSTGIVGI